MAKTKCDGWCVPAIFYVVLSIIGILMNFVQPSDGSGITDKLQNKLSIALVQAVFAGLWTWLIYWLCTSCNEGWAWFVLIGPFLIGLAIMFLIAIGMDVHQLKQAMGYDVAQKQIQPEARAEAEASAEAGAQPGLADRIQDMAEDALQSLQRPFQQPPRQQEQPMRPPMPQHQQPVSGFNL